MFSSRSVQIAALFSDVFGQALPNLCRSFYSETKAEMFFSVFAVALLAEGVDRNCTGTFGGTLCPLSPSSRRAWIEINFWHNTGDTACVALLAEGVDRNAITLQGSICQPVALLAEGVDRNSSGRNVVCTPPTSPSSRRAWIEIHGSCHKLPTPPVALLAEGVDRNLCCISSVWLEHPSPSSRRAWIEILQRTKHH